MMTLVSTMGNHWHAVERDLLSLGYRSDDIGTPKLTLWELISIVVAAPVGSAVHLATGKWDKSSEMLANYSEQQAGLLNLTGRYPRPGIDMSQAKTRSIVSAFKPYGGVPFEAMERDMFVQKRLDYIRMQNDAAQRAGKG